MRVPAPITLPVTSITTSMVSDADLGLISDVWDQRAAERLLLDACARRRAA
ncbi:protein of unassigned function [Methylobacterium oryzae CBMB20]|uniref:Protein of unassigned function n=1 Tax=Methylobacterium oryzae CBMB20 TaxID=693986 RepID=A0A089NMU7_9HYPH|nr:protein of unassigned function [Methylobacterium oryzae CBMB20]